MTNSEHNRMIEKRIRLCGADRMRVGSEIAFSRSFLQSTGNDPEMCGMRGRIIEIIKGIKNCPDRARIEWNDGSGVSAALLYNLRIIHH